MSHGVAVLMLERVCGDASRHLRVARFCPSFSPPGFPDRVSATLTLDRIEGRFWYKRPQPLG
jgi:hypothetical protein